MPENIIKPLEITIAGHYYYYQMFERLNDVVWADPGKKGTFLLADLRFKHYLGVKVWYVANWNALPKIILS